MQTDHTQVLITVRDWLRYAVSRFNAAGLAFGHGCADAYDEAAYLVLHTLHLPLDRIEPFLDACLTDPERVALRTVIDRRVAERLPAAYLTGEAWLCGHRFRVDPRVIVPRSFIAELLEEGLAPWVPDADEVGSVLDLCTGSGCLAILAALAFPHARVDAVDLSPDALEVAAANVADYGLAARVSLIGSDLFAALGGRRYDVILSNPPYVTAQAMRELPAEYRHEPALALAAGEDGLDIARRILAAAGAHLRPGGTLFVEVGHNRDLADAAFGHLPLTWINSRSGIDAVFMLHADALART